MKTSPLKAVTERFGDKQKLVSAVQKLITDELWLARVNETKGLERVSNLKLLRLHDTLSRVQKDFGSRAKLIDAILTLMKRQKDEGLRGRLQGFPTPRLLDLHTSTARRAKTDAKIEKAVKPAEKKKTPRSKVAKAKAASGEKKAPKAPAEKKPRKKAAKKAE